MPLQQIAFVSILMRGLGITERDAIEIVPTQTTDSAITVGFALKVQAAKRQRGKLRDQAGRKQGNRDPFAVRVAASDPSDALQEDVRIGRGDFAEDYLGPLEVGGCQRSREPS